MADHAATQRGLTRRQMIKASAVAGAAAWTAPAIVDSLASPAAAASVGAFDCSYASIVFTVGGGSPQVLKIQGGNPGVCQLTSATSSDASFSESCNGVTYSNTCSGNNMCANGAVVPVASSCPFTFTATTITAGAGVTILFAALHKANDFGFICGPTTFIDAGTDCCVGRGTC